VINFLTINQLINHSFPQPKSKPNKIKSSIDKSRCQTTIAQRKKTQVIQ